MSDTTTEVAANKVVFELVSPARLLYSDAVDMVIVPGSEGNFGVLRGHAPLISLVRAGTIDIHDGGKVGTRIFVSGGFAEVTPERCTVLAVEAIPVDEIDRGEAERRLAEARDELAAATEGEIRAIAERKVRAAEAMLDAAA